MSLDFVLRFTDVAEHWAMDRIDREAAWLNLVAVLQQVTEITQSFVHDWEIPGDCELRPVRRDEVRLPRGHGEYVLFDTRRTTAVLEFPLARLGYEFGIQTHVPDRCSINTCLTHWAISCGALWAPYVDSFHSLGSTLRNQANNAVRCAVSRRATPPPTALHAAPLSGDAARAPDDDSNPRTTTASRSYTPRATPSLPMARTQARP